jgi:hypothetical protein
VVSVLARPSAGIDPRLVRAYRRLLRAYPHGPRRDELLDTLIECAPRGRRRPTPREVANLALHGIRARLGRPASRGIVVLALFLALAGGFLGAAGTTWLGWQAVEPLPAGAEADEISATVFPGMTVWGGGDATRIVSQSDGEGIEYGYSVSWVKHTAATRDAATYTAGVRARLESAGWTVTDIDPPLDQTDVVDARASDRVEGFRAVRGTLGMRFSDYYWAGRPAYDGDGNATYYLWRQPPSWLATVMWLGFLPAALLTWLVTGWVSRRLEPHPGVSAPAATAGVLAVLCVVPAALITLAPGGPADETAAPSWDALAVQMTTPAVLFGMLAALVVLYAAAVRPPRRLRRWRRRAANALGKPRRRPAAVIAVAVMLAALGGYTLANRHAVPGSCTPSVPVGVVDPPGARMSYQARVFITPSVSDDQRNLAEAAIWRGLGGSQTFAGGPRADGFLTPFCDHGRVDRTVAEKLPHHWTVNLASPGLFGGLANEMMAMPGIVAVQHVPL